MATKAQLFRTQQQRDARPAKPKRPRRQRRDVVVDTSRRGVSATDRKAARLETGQQNRSKRAGNKGGARLEATSRKSTRKSAGRVKRDTGMRRKATWSAARKRGSKRR